MKIQTKAPIREPKNFKDIIVLMSGGVDSSVTALLLKEQGYNVIGVTMRLPVATSAERSCGGEDAEKVASQLGIDHYYIDTENEFYDYVIEPFRNDYIIGCTPSPCVDCNTKVKFGCVWDFIYENFSIKNLATGHYAKIYTDQEGTHLSRGRDLNRDQSYFLYGIKKEKLPYLQFPLEPYTKDEVREIAEKYGLKIAQKPDSMELCFAGEGDYREALNIANRPGNIIGTDGKILGEHKGIANYTIGQRKGLRVSAPYPLYVVDINSFTNTVTLGKKEEGLTDFVEIKDINILEPAKAVSGFKCRGKIRSNGDPKPCQIETISEDYAKIVFEKEFFKSAPGQKTVLYDEMDNIILGGTIR